MLQEVHVFISSILLNVDDYYLKKQESKVRIDIIVEQLFQFCLVSDKLTFRQPNLKLVYMRLSLDRSGPKKFETKY